MASVLERAEADIRLAEREVRRGRFQRSMALITAFSALVNGYEAYAQHRRGAFDQKLMWTPVWLTPPTLAAAGGALASERVARRLLPAIALVSIVDGIVGFIYHLKGIARLPGGFRLGQYNIVMGPPIFAPLLSCTVGATGLLAGALRRATRSLPPESVAAGAERLRRSDSLEQRVEHGRFQQEMALLAAFFGVLSGGEAYFEHLRGSFNQRLMWTPVWVTPPMVIAGVGAAFSRRIARAVLPFAAAVTLLDGMLGFFLHLRGIKRMPGGFGNLSFNSTLGPPLFAPLLFSAVGMLGLIAAILRRDER